jgi:predicted signal transduction protein with EAL and GGDEF domain
VGEYRFAWKDRIFNVGVSVGLVEISRESGTLEELLAAADTACYVAKKQGSGQVVVYSARDEALARHTGEIQWLQRLQGALKENRFHLYHQVIVQAPGVTGGPAMEVLIRLRDEAGHELPPVEFIRAAERYGLMGLVDRWVVQTTLTALGRGAIPVPADRSVAINISGQTLGDVQFLEFVVDCLDSTGVTPAQVCFDRRFLHAQPGARPGQPDDGDGDDQARPHTQFQGDCRAGRRHRGARCGASHRR